MQVHLPMHGHQCRNAKSKKLVGQELTQARKLAIALKARLAPRPIDLCCNVTWPSFASPSHLRPSTLVVSTVKSL